MKKDVKVNVQMWSNNHYIDIDGYDVENYDNKVEINAAILVKYEYFRELWLRFDALITIDDLNDIEEGEVYPLSKFKNDIFYTFNSCSLDPKNEYEAFRILEYSIDTISLGSELDSEINTHLKNKELVDNFNKLFGTSTIEELLDKFNELGFRYIDTSLYDELCDEELYDQNIVKKIFNQIHNYVLDNFEPNTFDGLSENIEESIGIKFDFR